MRITKCMALMGLLAGCAPQGTYYPVGSFVPKVKDACTTSEVERGFVRHLNAKVGRPDGPPSLVTSIEGLASSGAPVEDPTGIFVCRGTLKLADGKTDVGVVRSVDSGSGMPLKVSWVSDAAERRRNQATIATLQQQQRVSETLNVERAPIESDAVLFEKDKASLDLIQDLVSMVISRGFRCESVSGARPMITSTGYVLRCNRFRYTYDIQDKGGQWIVNVR